GGEFGQQREWSDAGELDWDLLEQEDHRGLQCLVKDLNHLYRSAPPLHTDNYKAEGFAWIDCHDAPQSVISYKRSSGDSFLIVILNFTPIPRPNYRIGVPESGRYCERLNSDSVYYGGSNLGNPYPITAEAKEWMGYSHSIALTLPPLGGLIL